MNLSNISGVSLIFDWGSSDRGRYSGGYSQADVVDGYGPRMMDELDYENIRTHHINTRKPPALTEGQRIAEVPANFVPVILSCDWHVKKRDANSSSVEFSGDFYKLADSICFSLAEWGRAYVFGHRVLKPIEVENDKPFIRIKPFALNGPHANEYMLRLDKLGEDLGRAIGGYLAEIRQGLRS